MNYEFFLRKMLRKQYMFSVITKRFLYRSTAEIEKEKIITTNDLLWKTIENGNIKSAQDWKNVRNEILNLKLPRISITPLNVDAITIGICTSNRRYNLALSYLDFLEQEKIKLNLATLGKYFRLLFIKSVEDGLSQDEEKRVLMLYDNLRKSHPILDALTLENIIQALSLTSKWKICLDLLEEIKITAMPNSNCYSAIVAAAFRENEENLGWQLFSEMIEKGKSAQPHIYSSYFNKVAKLKKKTDKLEALEKLFYFLQKNNVKLENNVIEIFIEFFNQMRMEIRPTIVTQKGICKCCKSKLKSFELTETEFEDLKNKIIQNVIVGKDVFHKTTSEELNRFKNFVANMEKFDVVIDGLNVAYSSGVNHSPAVTSGLVASVVSHFVEQGQKVLVLGRNHMNKWPKKNWGYVLQNATVFLTQDLSQDDPYLLYCALNSGKDTIIVTRDLMRSHKFLLKNAPLKVLFDRWLSQRQYQLVHIKDLVHPIFKKPMAVSNVVQKNDDFWHLPYTTSNQERSPPSNTWLCIKFTLI